MPTEFGNQKESNHHTDRADVNDERMDAPRSAGREEDRGGGRASDNHQHASPGRSKVGEVQAMFDCVLTAWAGDWLRLMARGLDRPTVVGRTARHAPPPPPLPRRAGRTDADAEVDHLPRRRAA